MSWLRFRLTRLIKRATYPRRIANCSEGCSRTFNSAASRCDRNRFVHRFRWNVLFLWDRLSSFSRNVTESGGTSPTELPHGVLIRQKYLDLVRHMSGRSRHVTSFGTEPFYPNPAVCHCTLWTSTRMTNLRNKSQAITCRSTTRKLCSKPNSHHKRLSQIAYAHQDSNEIVLDSGMNTSPTAPLLQILLSILLTLLV